MTGTYWGINITIFLMCVGLGYLFREVRTLRRGNAKLTRAMVKLTTVVMRVNHLSLPELEKLMGCQAQVLMDELAARRVERES